MTLRITAHLRDYPAHCQRKAPPRPSRRAASWDTRELIPDMAIASQFNLPVCLERASKVNGKERNRAADVSTTRLREKEGKKYKDFLPQLLPCSCTASQPQRPVW
eukprot:GFKZ01000607.1.p2 GENE.GFKZ01000607.1~~GFKZ01000607.1.p2  ORF type:complete len:105 (-),score=3.77 GFKZ01000607.1:133-447(-)